MVCAMKKAGVLSILFVVVLLAVAAEAQQPAKIPRIGYVSGTGDASNQGPYVEALRQGLRDLGYVEGQNLVTEQRYAEGSDERLRDLAADLAQLHVAVIVAGGSAAIRAAQHATQPSSRPP